jgi:hypothetical protein
VISRLIEELFNQTQLNRMNDLVRLDFAGSDPARSSGRNSWIGEQGPEAVIPLTPLAAGVIVSR